MDFRSVPISDRFIRRVRRFNENRKKWFPLPNACILRGEFHFSYILTSKIRHMSILPPNDPILVLKRLLALELWKFRKKFWPLIFGFGESPKSRNFFSNFFYKNWNSSFIFQYFSKNPKTCVKRLVWANNVESRFLIFLPFYIFGGSKSEIMLHGFTFRLPKNIKQQKIKNRLPTLFAQTSF